MAETMAFIGLGAMGSGMARCLVRTGFAVRGFDVRQAAVDQLAADGGLACRSPAEAAQGASLAAVIVLNADQVEEVVFGEQGLAGALPRGGVVVCMSTMSPARSRGLAARAADSGLGWLDAPVSGGTQRAAEGSLTTMVGAQPEHLERARALLEGFSSHVFHLGPVGSGSTAKMVNQILVFCNLAATAEAIALCRKAGADVQTMYDVICTAMGTSAIFESRVPKVVDGSYQSGGSMRIALKDLAIVEDTAREVGMPMWMSAQASQLFRAAAAAGLQDADDLAVVRLVEQLAGL